MQLRSKEDSKDYEIGEVEPLVLFRNKIGEPVLHELVEGSSEEEKGHDTGPDVGQFRLALLDA